MADADLALVFHVVPQRAVCEDALGGLPAFPQQRRGPQSRVRQRVGGLACSMGPERLHGLRAGGRGAGGGASQALRFLRPRVQWRQKGPDIEQPRLLRGTAQQTFSLLVSLCAQLRPTGAMRLAQSEYKLQFCNREREVEITDRERCPSSYVRGGGEDDIRGPTTSITATLLHCFGMHAQVNI